MTDHRSSNLAPSFAPFKEYTVCELHVDLGLLSQILVLKGVAHDVRGILCPF